jgi:hypothetical protein
MSQSHHDKFVEVLAYVYNSINWSRIRVRSPHDVWNHRVRAAVTRPTLAEAVSRLANFFSVQSVPQEAVQLVREIEEHQDELLDAAAREHIVYAMRAVMRAKEMRSKRKSDMSNTSSEQLWQQ